MKKIIIALAAIVTSAFGVQATEYSNSLLVNKTDGSTVEYRFADVPVATIEGDDLKIEVLMTRESVLYPMNEIKNLTFKKEVSGVEGIVADGNHVMFGLSGDILEAAGLEAGTEIAIFDLGGVMRISAKADADGCATIKVSDLGQGVFLVKGGKHMFKFIR